MQKFENMEHSNSRTFQGLSRAWIFIPKFKVFQGLLKDHMNPGLCVPSISFLVVAYSKNGWTYRIDQYIKRHIFSQGCAFWGVKI